MAASLYRKYRPQRFVELVGQEHIALALQNAISQNRLSHAYLFSGTRGTGKTSTARILGAVLNCHNFKDGFPATSEEIEPCGECENCIATRAGNSFDVIELDAASNNGVDDMRELIEKVSYTSAAGGTKVYIIDEVHELTGRASNALLKTLEEPPEHVVFVLATTNPEKVLPTIRSRTQHYEFVSPNEEKLAEHVKDILSWEEKTLDDDAIDFVVKKGAGSVRDTLSYLDQVLALDVSTLSELESLNASDDVPVILDLIVCACTGDTAGVFNSLHKLTNGGKEPRAIVENIINVSRDCLILSLNPSASILLCNYSDKDELKNVGEKCGVNFLRQLILKLGKAVADMRGTATLNPLLNVEVALLASMPDSEQRAVSTSPAHAGSTTPAYAGSTTPAHAGSTPPSSSLSASRPSGRSEPKVSSLAADVRDNLGGVDPSESRTSPKKTLGALKSQTPTSVKSVEKNAEPVQAVPSKKVTLHDVSASWPKVVGLLSVASQESIKKTEPISLRGDVLTFGVSTDDLEEVKSRFKKDASLIRGFLESIHGQEFKFKVEAGHAKKEQADTEEEISEDKMLEESKEYDPVEEVVSMFGGEVVE
ncbi:MAG: DNA polymerase III subunit gamma/tau [Acidimicrobiia bacterium]